MFVNHALYIRNHTMVFVSMYLTMLVVLSFIVVLTVKLGERYQENIFAIFVITIANLALMLLAATAILVIFNTVVTL